MNSEERSKRSYTRRGRKQCLTKRLLTGELAGDGDRQLVAVFGQVVDVPGLTVLRH